MAQTVIGTFKGRDEAHRAIDALIQNGVPRQDIALASHGSAVAVTTDAILGSAVYDILARNGATSTDVHHDASHLSGWERLDPHNDPPLPEQERAVPDNAAAWQESSKVGTVGGAVAGAATGAGLGLAGGPVGAVVGGIAGGIVGATTGAAADIAGEIVDETVEDQDDAEDER
jgi:hypothetical protein